MGAVCVTAAALTPPLVYRDGPPPGHTGGFGETTCRECHFDNPPAGERGELAVRGFPKHPRSDSVYPLRVELAREGMERAGFQLAIRWDSGGLRRGRSAGRLAGRSSRVQTVQGPDSVVSYAQHTEEGSIVTSGGTRARWGVRWTAPGGCGPVVLHVAANAANGDNSEFGDHVYSMALRSRIPCERRNEEVLFREP